MDLNDELAAHLHESVVPGRVAQELIKAFEGLNLSPNQRQYVLDELIKPLINQANKQYDEGLAVGKMMGNPWDNPWGNPWGNPWEEDESSEGYYD